MTTKEILEFQAEREQFASHPLGKAFLQFENAHARAWTLDTEDSCTDRDRKSTREAWNTCNERRQEFVTMLKELMK